MTHGRVEEVTFHLAGGQLLERRTIPDTRPCDIAFTGFSDWTGAYRPVVGRVWRAGELIEEIGPVPMCRGAVMTVHIETIHLYPGPDPA